jgi:hypothetical protein
MWTAGIAFWLHTLREMGSDWLCGKVRQVSFGVQNKAKVA